MMESIDSRDGNDINNIVIIGPINGQNNRINDEIVHIIINNNEEPNVANNSCINEVFQKGIITLISIISFFIISIDLSIAFTENSCINNYMKIYLIISSIFILVLLLIYVYNKNIINLIIENRYLIFFSMYIYTFIIMGYMLCTILGSILYWNIIDRNKCSYFVNNYLYIIFIIKIIILFYLLYNKFFIL